MNFCTSVTAPAPPRNSSQVQLCPTVCISSPSSAPTRAAAAATYAATRNATAPLTEVMA
eukprot:CAMPEP_0198687732 /NCGR_PEP_ID=MMETSP1468-20131203/73716_1 /TAXON_ID=1461545 /ORGANISM="Mantoniella sp, Strain CCMP1436" /LENGTH=58 /DNA_ID=CAMNT_0044436137 /DNA_START=477 /DNA_END=653 /DNA_ORIENTATION=-